jgi:hypothetical protein
MSGTVTNGVLQPFGGNGSNSNTSLGYQSVAGGIINIITFSSAFATATGNWAVARGTITLANTQTVAAPVGAADIQRKRLGASTHEPNVTAPHRLI